MQGAEQQQAEKQSCLGGDSTFLVPVGIWGVSQDPQGLMEHLGMWGEEGMLSLQTTGAGKAELSWQSAPQSLGKAPSPGIQILAMV